jgi:hypothetical protein
LKNLEKEEEFINFLKMVNNNEIKILPSLE